MKCPKDSKAELVLTDKDGNVSKETIYDFKDSAGIIQGLHGELVGQPVRAQKHIPPLTAQRSQKYIRRNIGLCADAARDDIAAGISARLGKGQLSAVDQVLHQRMIM